MPSSVVLRYAESFESRQAACRREYELSNYHV